VPAHGLSSRKPNVLSDVFEVMLKEFKNVQEELEVWRPLIIEEWVGCGDVHYSLGWGECKLRELRIEFGEWR
jgi:hypothetical protein